MKLATEVAQNEDAAGPDAFPFRLLVRGLETVLEESATGRAIAWLTVELEHITTHPPAASGPVRWETTSRSSKLKVVRNNDQKQNQRLDGHSGFGNDRSMIVSFADKETEKVFRQERSRKLPRDIQSPALAKLLILHALTDIKDLQGRPGLHCEKLAGKPKNFWSIRINRQWRLCFTWDESTAAAGAVHIVDYH